ncbi:Growth arrest-specific protein 7 [Sciurus carolinensis]|uniref:Growth arrest-specific protein 7 n=1 Tax=Sciurus carolinensis TaxID=30640 RepID=A0AA41SRM3_SCICA|nr:Growth arrest-specific protein 7 [Sciurus carolinensis]
MGSGKESLADEEVHLMLSTNLHSTVEKPLIHFRENFKKDMKKCDHHISDLHKQLTSCYAFVEKAQKALREAERPGDEDPAAGDQAEQKEGGGHAWRKTTQAGDDLILCVDLYKQTQFKWFEEMVTTKS